MAYGNEDNGVKLIGAIIVLILVGGGLSFRCLGNVSGENKVTAESEAREYAKSLGVNAKGVQCAHNDSDGDGYVSCTLSIEKPDGSMQLEPIECAVKFTTNSGCRVQKPSVRR